MDSESCWSRMVSPFKRRFCVQNSDGIFSLIGGFALHLTLGTLYCFGNLNTYITSYIRMHVHEGILYSDMIWIPTLATIAQGSFMTFSGHLEEKIGVRLTVGLGCSIMVLGVLLTSVAVQLSVVLTAITYGCCFGLGLALAYAPPLGVAMKWFPKSKGLVNGIIVGGFGLGAFIFNQIQTAYLNPLNHKLDDGKYFTDEKILNRVPSLFLLLGSLYAVIQILAVFLIKPPPESDMDSMMPLVSPMNDVEFDEDSEEAGNNYYASERREESNPLVGGNGEGDDEEEDLELNNPSTNGFQYDSNRSTSSIQRNFAANDENTNSDNNANQNNHRSRMVVRINQDQGENIRPGKMIKTREFWILWLTFFLNTQSIGYINAMYKAYGQSYIIDDHFLSIVGALAAIFNATGRIFWGNLCDGYGYRNCMTVVSMSTSMLYLTFNYIQFGHKPLFALWVWGIFFCFCANFVLIPTATAQCFGTKYSSKNYGLVMTGQAVAAPVIAILTEFLSPALGWLGMFTIIASFSLASAVMNLCFFPSNPSPKKILNRIERPIPSDL